MSKIVNKEKLAVVMTLGVLGANEVIPVVTHHINNKAEAEDIKVNVPKDWVDKDGKLVFNQDLETVKYLLEHVVDAKGFIKNIKINNYVGVLNLQIYNKITPVTVAADGKVQLKNIESQEHFKQEAEGILTEIQKHKGKDEKEIPLVFFTNKRDKKENTISTNEFVGFSTNTEATKQKEIDWLKEENNEVIQLKAEEDTKAEGFVKAEVPFTYVTNDLFNTKVKEQFTQGTVNLTEVKENQFVETKNVKLSDLPIVSDVNKILYRQLKAVVLKTITPKVNTEVPLSGVQYNTTKFNPFVPEGQLIVGHTYSGTYEIAEGTNAVIKEVKVNNQTVNYELKDNKLIVNNLVFTPEATEVNITGNIKEIKKSQEDNFNVEVEKTWKENKAVEVIDKIKTIKVNVPVNTTKIEAEVNGKNIYNQNVVITSPGVLELPIDKTLASFGAAPGETIQLVVRTNDNEKIIPITTKQIESKKAEATKTVEEQAPQQAQQNTAVPAGIQTDSFTPEQIEELVNKPLAQKNEKGVNNDHVLLKVVSNDKRPNRLLGDTWFIGNDYTFNMEMDGNNYTTQNVMWVLYSKEDGKDKTEIKRGTFEGINAENNNIYHQFKISDMLTPGTTGNLYIRVISDEGGYTTAIPLYKSGSIFNTFFKTEGGQTGSNTMNENGNYQEAYEQETIDNIKKLGFYPQGFESTSTFNMPTPAKIIYDEAAGKDISWYAGPLDLGVSLTSGVGIFNAEIYKAEGSSDLRPENKIQTLFELEKSNGKFDFSKAPTKLENTIKYEDNTPGVQRLQMRATALTGDSFESPITYFAVDVNKPVVQLVTYRWADLLEKSAVDNVFKKEEDKVELQIGLMKVDSTVNKLTNNDSMENANTEEGMTVKLYNGDQEIIQSAEEKAGNMFYIDRTGVYYLEVINQLGVSSGKLPIGQLPNNDGIKSSLFIKDSEEPQVSVKFYDKMEEVGQEEGNTEEGNTEEVKTGKKEVELGNLLEPVGKYKVDETTEVPLYNQYPKVLSKVIDKGTNVGVLKTVAQLGEPNNLESVLKTFYQRDLTVPEPKEGPEAITSELTLYNEDIIQRPNKGVYQSINIIAEDMVNLRDEYNTNTYAVDTLPPVVKKTSLNDGTGVEVNNIYYINKAGALDLNINAADEGDNENVSSGLNQISVLINGEVKATKEIKDVDLTKLNFTTDFNLDVNALQDKVVSIQLTDKAGNKTKPLSISELLGGTPDLPIQFIIGSSQVEVELEVPNKDYNGWYKENPPAITGTATGENDLKALIFEINGKEMTIDLEKPSKEVKFDTKTMEEALTTFITENSIEGENTVKVTAVNVVNDKGLPGTATFKLDKTAPTGNYTVEINKEKDIVDEKTKTVYSRTPFELSLSTSDNNGSGVSTAQIFYKSMTGQVRNDIINIDQKENITWEMPVDLVEIDKIILKDQVGYETELTGNGYQYIVVDAIPTITDNIASLQADYEKDGVKYFKAVPQIKAEATDKIEIKEFELEAVNDNAKAIKSTLTGQGLNKAILTVSTIPEGLSVFKFKAADMFINEPVYTPEYQIYLDTTPPEIKEATIDGKVVVDENKVLTGEYSLRLQVKAEDEGAGVKEIILMRNGTALTSNTTGVFDLTENGSYSIKVIDNVGNEVTKPIGEIVSSLEGNSEINFIKEKPSVQLTAQGDIVKLKDKQGKLQQFTKDPITVIVKIDSTIPLKSKTISVNGIEQKDIEWNNLEGQLVLTDVNTDPQGVCTVVATVEDILGNKVSSSVEKYYFDTKAPHLDSINLLGGPIGIEKDKTLFANKVEVEFNGSDINPGAATSGVKQVLVTEVETRKVTTLKPGENFIIDKNGEFEYQIEDMLGNISKKYTTKDLYPEVESNYFEKYDIQPQVTITAENALGQEVSENQLVADTLKITVIPEKDVKVKDLEVKVNNKKVELNEDGSFMLPEAAETNPKGIYTIQAILTDAVGQKQIVTKTYKIDVTTPYVKDVDIKGITATTQTAMFFKDKVDVKLTLGDGADSEGYTDLTIFKDEEEVDKVKVDQKTGVAAFTLKEGGKYSFKVADTVGHEFTTTLGELSGVRNNNLIYAPKQPELIVTMNQKPTVVGNQEWYKVPPTMTIDAAATNGAEVPLTSIVIKVNNKVVEELNNIAQLKYKEDFDLSKYKDAVADNGEMIITVEAIDLATNTAKEVKKIFIDQGLPTMTISEITPIYTNDVKGLYTNKDVNVTLKLSNYNQDVPLKTLEVMNEKGKIVQTIKEPKPSETIVLKESGNYKFVVTNNLGVSSEPQGFKALSDNKYKADNLIINKIAPKITINEEKGKDVATIVIESKYFNPEATEVVLDGKKLEIEKWNKRVDGVYFVNVTLTKEGKRNIKVTSTDLTGNKTINDKVIDVNKPVIPPVQQPSANIVVDWLDGNSGRVFNGITYYRHNRTATITIKSNVKLTDLPQGYNFKESGKEGAYVYTANKVYTVQDRIEVLDLNIKYNNKVLASYNSGQFIIDKIAPVVSISGVQNKALYKDDAVPVVEVTDTNFEKIEWSIRGMALPSAYWASDNNSYSSAPQQSGGGIETAEDALNSAYAEALPQQEINVIKAEAATMPSTPADLENGVPSFGPQTPEVPEEAYVPKEETIIVDPNSGYGQGGGNSNSGGTITNPGSTGTSDGDGFVPSGGTDTSSSSSSRDERDSVNDNPNDNKAGAWSASGTSTSKRTVLPDIPHERRYDGGYVLTVTAYDKAGNTTTKTVQYGVRRFGTSFSKTFAAFGSFVTETEVKDLDLKVKDLKTGKVTQLKDNEFKITNVEKKEDSSIPQYIVGYEIKKKVLPDANYEGVFYKKGTDITVGTVNFTIDTTPPTIDFGKLKSNKTYTGKDNSFTVKVTDNLTDPTLIDIGTEVNGEFRRINEKPNKDGVYKIELPVSKKPYEIKITATDIFGNKAEAKVENIKVRKHSFTPYILLIGALICLSGFTGLYLSDKKKKKEKDEPKEGPKQNNN